jgi:hypothetical protein
MCEQVEKLCALGATDEEIASFFGVSARTIYRWKLDYPRFCQALTSGKQAPDDRVERSLYQMAVGTYVTQQQAIKVKTGQYTEDVKIVEVEVFQPAEAGAAIFWLKNRRKDQWRDKQDHDVNLTGKLDIASQILGTLHGTGRPQPKASGSIDSRSGEDAGGSALASEQPVSD